MHTSRMTLTAIASTVLLLILGFVALDVCANIAMPDFYNEPGLNPFREATSSNVSESVDPYSGGLTIAHTDLVIPGAGGLDIKIKRIYNSNNVFRTAPGGTNTAPYASRFQPRGTMGLGWTMHFGRLIHTPADANLATVDLCQTSNFDPSVPPTVPPTNPVLETPDGNKEVLYVARNQNLATFITKNQWVGECIKSGGVSVGMKIISPNGIVYTMNKKIQTLVEAYDLTPTNFYYTTKIEDPDGNYLNINYSSTNAKTYPIINSITSSDNRTVNFTYLDATNPSAARISTIKQTGGATWTYDYSPANGLLDADYFLTGVRVSNTEFSSTSHPLWKYEYHDKAGITDPDLAAGKYLLKQITYPSGGTVFYDYGYVDFFKNTIVDGSLNYYALVVDHKEVRGFKGAPTTFGTDNPTIWNYSYTPDSTEDKTTVTVQRDSTTYTTVYHHYGAQSQFNGNPGVNNKLWKIGLLKSKEVYEGTVSTNNLKRAEVYDWVTVVGTQSLSNQYFIRKPIEDPRNNGGIQYDDHIFPPLLNSVQTTVYDSLAGQVYTRNYQYDLLTYQPVVIEEQWIEGGTQTRTTRRQFFPRVKNQNIVGLVADEWLGTSSLINTPTNRKIVRQFNLSTGRMTQENRYGVVTDFTYDTNGNLSTRTDARGKKWTYTNYYRGIPRNASHTSGVTLSRTVDTDGTILTDTNGLGFTTTYTYDDLNRITSIKLPKVATDLVTITYQGYTSTSGASRTIVRGNYKQKITFDGFQNPSCVVAQDTTGESVAQSTGYDFLGRRYFASNPQSGTNCTPTIGTFTDYDVRDRITRRTQTDGKTIQYSYLSGNRVSVKDEENHYTTYIYRSYANPDDSSDRLLTRVENPDLGGDVNKKIITTLVRNDMGLVESVTQGSNADGFVTRQYDYSNPNNNFMQFEVNPETGTTSYDLYDALGNLKQKTIGGLTTSYTYDDLSRLTLIDYPGTTPDVSITYDGNDNRKTVNNGVANWTYEYDENDNPLTETVVIGARSFAVTYNFNNLDQLSSIDYPSGQLSVDYAPDALGRPSKVGAFVTNLAYFPNGLVSSMTYANGRQQTTTQDTRLRPKDFTVPGVSQLTYDYFYNGNVKSITDSLQPSNNKTFGYDGVNRLISATGPWGSGNITYSAFGNIMSKSIGGADVQNYVYDGTNKLASATVNGTSRSFGYDGSGNVTSDGQFNYSYDGANNLRTMGVGSNPDIFLDYDGNNLRVKRRRGARPVQYYFYNAAGQLLGEYSDSTGDAKEYIYLDSKLIAERSNVAGNTPPSADAGADIAGYIGNTISLNGIGTDTDGTISAYQWRQTSGAAVSLANAGTATASFDATGLAVGAYAFNFFVTDDDGARAVDSLMVTILDPTNPDSDNDTLMDAWEIQYFGNLNQGATDDPDLDGFTNKEEQDAGTDPTSAVPTSLTATGTAPTEIQLAWDSNSNVTYNIYWSQTPGVTKATGTKIANVSSPYLHTGLEFSKTYYYVVTTNKTDGTESAESAEVSLELNDISWLIPILDLIME